MVDLNQKCLNCGLASRLAVPGDFGQAALSEGGSNPALMTRHQIAMFSIAATLVCENPECPIRFFNIEWVIAGWKKNLVLQKEEALIYQKTMLSMIGRICKKDVLEGDAG